MTRTTKQASSGSAVRLTGPHLTVTFFGSCVKMVRFPTRFAHTAVRNLSRVRPFALPNMGSPCVSAGVAASARSVTGRTAPRLGMSSISLFGRVPPAMSDSWMGHGCHAQL